ncbi:hypothetical protein CABS02_00826 [Colletotrichum abscissum]|uniref:DUF7871 domain-containing protein n=1 Tax=Colletotrichum abscissum TaxID=1671311 RepID=A0A9P9XSA9_9PEZI|nr:hypothetical protein CABS02_00826 [Colletotrichum abscissum]
MTVTKASTCCGKSAECVCGMYFSSPDPPIPQLQHHLDISLVLEHNIIFKPSITDNDTTKTLQANPSCSSAQQATCSCGKQSALHCTCSKAASENAVAGPRCSCRARPVGECTCDRAATENTKPSGETCSCGSRPADACTCDKAATTTYDRSEHEIDFTTRQ